MSFRTTYLLFINNCIVTHNYSEKHTLGEISSMTAITLCPLMVVLKRYDLYIEQNDIEKHFLIAQRIRRALKLLNRRYFVLSTVSQYWYSDVNFRRWNYSFFDDTTNIITSFITHSVEHCSGTKSFVTGFSPRNLLADRFDWCHPERNELLFGLARRNLRRASSTHKPRGRALVRDKITSRERKEEPFLPSFERYTLSTI